MSKFLNYLGGVIGGFSLIYIPVSGLLPSLEPLIDAVGIIIVIVFAVALIITGVRSLLSKA
ncbi:hypothetical protein [Paenibacillus harenae]|uniref:DUF1232 domain-containing protein n=1 Tax=Paenibacillus harenae TaxID=306543 RepID=A0ABT9U482_PAEHA|nr:hypothetical protein [Paenibacillus harenae]MDQ0059924.1 hypothetical protein [Paenibacillus harenae]MDQ0114057.1 hypothetical protein [Paenibacillus harenae]